MGKRKAKKKESSRRISQRTEVKKTHRRAFRNALILGLILCIIWAVLVAFVADGWWMTAIDIGFFIVMGIVIAMPSIAFFKLYVPTIMAVVLTSVVWVLMVAVVRLIILKLSG